MKNTITNRVRVLLLVASISGAAAYVARAQNNTLPDDYFKAPAKSALPLTDKWAGDLMIARTRLKTARDYSDDATKYFDAKTRVGELMRGAVGNNARTGFLAESWGATDGGDAFAFTVLQNQKLIEQNAEIIALLKAKK